MKFKCYGIPYFKINYCFDFNNLKKITFIQDFKFYLCYSNKI